MNQLIASEAAVHANAGNRRIGENHKRWFAAASQSEGTIAHWLANAAEGSTASEATVALASMFKGSTTQLARGWADDMIAGAAEAIGMAGHAESTFRIAQALLGAGRSTERKAEGSIPSRPAQGMDFALAIAEFDTDESAQAIFTQLARQALAAKGATHLCIHAGYGRANGYRGAHVMLDLADLIKTRTLRAESWAEKSGVGASIHVYAEIAGERVDLVSFKRKGGDGPKEKRGDHLQATLLYRGAMKAGRTLCTTASLIDTGRKVTAALPRALAH